MKETWKQKQLKYIEESFNKSKNLAKEVWIDGDYQGNDNDFYYFQCGFVAGLNYQRLKSLEKLSELDQEMGLE